MSNVNVNTSWLRTTVAASLVASAINWASISSQPMYQLVVMKRSNPRGFECPCHYRQTRSNTVKIRGTGERVHHIMDPTTTPSRSSGTLHIIILNGGRRVDTLSSYKIVVPILDCYRLHISEVDQGSCCQSLDLLERTKALTEKSIMIDLPLQSIH